MRKYWVLVGLLLVAGLLFAQNRANYDKNYYEPIKLKPFKTHPNTFVPEKVELEPDLEPAPKATTETTKPVLTKKYDKKADINQEVIVGQKEQESKTDIKSESIDNNSASSENIVAKFKSQEEKIEKEEPKNPFTFLPKGKSKAFKITPVEGITISAEENALDKDREFTMKALSEKQIDDFGDKFNAERKETGCVISAWELHAGMADNEVLEGSFKMEFDLEKLGVLPEFYENVACYRIDDQGNWFEYVIEHKGKNASVASRQNSMMVLAVKDTITIAYDSKDDEIKLVTDKNDKNFSHLDDLYKVINKKNNTVVWEIKYDEADWILGKESKGFVNFSPIAMKELTDELNRLYKITKTSAEVSRKTIADLKNNNYNFNDKVVFRQLQEKHTQEALKNNQNFQEKAKKLAKLYKDYETIAKKLQSCCQMACDYYYDVIYEDIENNKKNYGLKQVTYKVDIKIIDKKEKGAETPTNFWLCTPEIEIPYVAIKENSQSEYDNFTLTVCHEMFHVVQRNCYSKYRSCLKWDEATAQYFEDDALQWFKDHGKMNEDTENTDYNADFWEYYTIPLNNDMGFIEGKYYQYSFGNKAALGYPLSHFLRYLNEKKIKTEKAYKDKRWHDFNNSYSWYQSYPAFTTLLYDTFGIKEKEATEYYINFAKDYSEKFYERIKSTRETILSTGFTEAPYLLFGAKEVGKNGQKVVFEDENYTIRVREIYSYVPKNYFDDINRKVALQIVLDPDFKHIMPDRDFKPIGPEKSTETQRGYFYFPINPNEVKYNILRNYEEKGDYIAKYFYLLEIDGGTDELHERVKDRGNLNGLTAGYTIWTMYAPELKKENPMDFETVEEIVDGQKKEVEKVCLQLPEKSEAAEKGKCIDGYLVGIKIDKGEKIVKHFEMDKIKDQKVYFDFDELKPKDYKEGDPVTGQVCIAEYVLSNTGERLKGPESEKVRFGLEKKDYIGVMRWGDFLGSQDVIPEAKVMWKGNHIFVDIPKHIIKNGNFSQYDVEIGEMQCELIFDEKSPKNNTNEDYYQKATFVKKPDKWSIKYSYKDEDGFLVKEEVSVFFDDKTIFWYYENNVNIKRRNKVGEFGLFFEGYKERSIDYGREVELIDFDKEEEVRKQPPNGKINPYLWKRPTKKTRYLKTNSTRGNKDFVSFDASVYFSTYLTPKIISEWKKGHK